jgi:hypothetical protein
MVPNKIKENNGGNMSRRRRVREKPEPPAGSSNILWVAGSIFLIAFIACAIHFSNSWLAECLDPEKCDVSSGADYRAAWGQFGDFMGGLVNPLIGLITIFLLLRSLRQNEIALRLSRDELEATREAVEQAVDAQKKMERSLQAQLKEAKSQNNFANYFKHLDEFTKYYLAIVSANPSFNFSGDARGLHSLLYPKAKFGDFSINRSVTVLIAESIEKMLSPFSQWGKSYEITEQRRSQLRKVQLAMVMLDISYLFKPHLKLSSKALPVGGNRASNIEKISIYLALVCYEFDYIYRSEFEDLINYLEILPASIERDGPEFDLTLQQHLKNAPHVRDKLGKVKAIIKSVKEDSH